MMPGKLFNYFFYAPSPRFFNKVTKSKCQIPILIFLIFMKFGLNMETNKNDNFNEIPT